MKPKVYTGWATVGKFGRIIALQFDDDKPPLVQLGFTDEEAKTTKEKIYRFEFSLPKP